MHPKRFDEVVDARLNDCKLILCNKEKEYSDGKDRLHNFKVSARIDDESPAKALWGMWKKHITSIKDIIDQMEANPEFIPSEAWVKDKCGDNINYTLLLEAVIEDKRDFLKSIPVVEEVTFFSR